MRVGKFNIYLLVSLGLAAVFVFFNSFKGSIVNSDDAIYAQIIKQILLGKNWLDLYWQSYAYMFKPPLFFDTGALSASLFGLNEFSLRLPAMLSSILLILTVFYFAKEFGDDFGAFLSCLILLSLKLYLNLSKRVMLDIPLTLFITLSIYSFYKTKYSKNYAVSGFAFSGLAFMVKGFAFFPALLTPAIYFLLNKRFKDLDVKRCFLGVFAFALIVLPWIIYKLINAGSSFVDLFVKSQVIDHYSGHGMAYFQKSFLFYFSRLVELHSNLLIFVALAILFAFIHRRKVNLQGITSGDDADAVCERRKISPSGILPGPYSKAEGITPTDSSFQSSQVGVKATPKAPIIDFRKFTILFIWVGSSLLILSFSSAKLDHYLVVIYPAVAIFCGITFSDSLRHFKGYIRKAFTLTVVCLALINFLPYLNSQDWHVDSSREIKKLSQKYNSLDGKKDGLFVYEIYLPAPVFYTQDEVKSIEPTSFRYNLFSKIGEFKHTGKLLNISSDEEIRELVLNNRFICIAREEGLKKFTELFDGINVLSREGDYSLFEVLPAKSFFPNSHFLRK